MHEAILFLKLFVQLFSVLFLIRCKNKK